METSEKNPVVNNGIDIWRGCAIPDNMIKDAFAALALAVLQDFWLSGDTKTMLFHDTISNLKQMNYSEEDIEKFRVALNKTYKKFHKPNGFMG